MTFHKKKQDILDFMEKFDSMLGRYKKFHGAYPENIPFLIYLFKLPSAKTEYRNRPPNIFNHLLLASGVAQKALYPKISSMDWSSIQSISLENIIIPTIDPGAVYETAPEMPRHFQQSSYLVPSFILESYSQDNWYHTSW